MCVSVHLGRVLCVCPYICVGCNLTVTFCASPECILVSRSCDFFASQTFGTSDFSKKTALVQFFCFRCLLASWFSLAAVWHCWFAVLLVDCGAGLGVVTSSLMLVLLLHNRSETVTRGIFHDCVLALIKMCRLTDWSIDWKVDWLLIYWLAGCLVSWLVHYR